MAKQIEQVLRASGNPAATAAAAAALLILQDTVLQIYALHNTAQLTVTLPSVQQQVRRQQAQAQQLWQEVQWQQLLLQLVLLVGDLLAVE